MPHRVNEIVPITIEGLGPCSLIPLHNNPPQHTTYLHAENLTRALPFKPLPVLSHETLQEIYCTLALYFIFEKTEPQVGVSIYLSSVHTSYPHITAEPIPKKCDCITSMELFFLGEGAPVEMTLCEVPVNETREVLGDDLLYVLFLGELE
jgi:hypothetical protein